MASIRSKGNRTTEHAFLVLLRRAKISGWRRHPNLPGKPDFVFRRRRLVVFVDGCFWHGCPRCYRPPEDNSTYWQGKLASNRHRDLRRTRELRALNWRVLRIWEHSLKSSLGRASVLSRLVTALNVEHLVGDHKHKGLGLGTKSVKQRKDANNSKKARLGKAALFAASRVAKRGARVAWGKEKGQAVGPALFYLDTMCCVCLRLDDRYDETESVQISEQITLRFRSGSSLRAERYGMKRAVQPIREKG